MKVCQEKKEAKVNQGPVDNADIKEIAAKLDYPVIQVIMATFKCSDYTSSVN